MSPEKADRFGIDFVDPDELIDFIEEEKSTESPRPPTQVDKESQETDVTESVEDLDEFEDEDDLTFTDKIVEEASEYVVKRKEDTRGRLAVLYTVFTFIIFIIGIAICVLDGLNRSVSIIDNLSTVLPLLSGLFLGTLGFVLGYYFRKDDE